MNFMEIASDFYQQSHRTKAHYMALTEAIIDAVVENRLPKYVESRGCTYFSKIETDIPLVDALQDTYEICEVVSPPFPISNSFASSLIASYGASLQEAMLRFREAKKRVFNTMNRGRQ